MYEFEPYIPQKGRFTPLISIGSSGSIGISAGFTKKYDLSGVSGVVLHYDRVNKAIGIKFCKSTEPGIISIKLSGKGGGIINGKSFFIKYDIDPKIYKNRFSPKEIITKQGRLYVFDIEKAK